MTALTDPVPLRKNVVWGVFAGAISSGSNSTVYLPHRYGDCGGELIQYDQHSLQFLFADHPVQSIDQVLVDGVPVTGWTWANTNDVTGQAVAMVTFPQAVDQGATPLGRGKGKLHPSTGDLMTDPAAILWDLLANIAGRDVAESQFGEFSKACAARSLAAGGSIESADAVATVANAICSSVGAVFAAPNLAVIWPGGDSGITRTTISESFGHVLTCSAQLSSAFNDFTISYDYEAGSPRQSMQLDAPDSVARFGRRTTTYAAPWLVSARAAYDVANRILQQQARAQWAIHVDGIKDVVNVGQCVNLNHIVSPVSGPQLVQTAEVTFATGVTAIDIVAPIGSVPVTRIVQQSQAFDQQSYAGVGVQTVGNDRVLTLDNNDGSPIVNAAVTLDGAITRFSDTAGRVSFPANVMPVGSHTLSIVTADNRTLTTTVLVQ